MKTIAAAALGYGLTIALISGSAVALNARVASGTLPPSLAKPVANCRYWVSVCLKRWGTAGPRYGRCLRNHGC
jgi:hypothetical protein